MNFLNFPTKAKARNYLATRGFSYEKRTGYYGNPNDTKGEIWGRGRDTAIMRPVPFKGIRVWFNDSPEG